MARWAAPMSLIFLFVPVVGTCTEPLVRSGDMVCEISSRGLSALPNTSLEPKFDVHLIQGTQWSPRSFSDLVADVKQSDRRVVFYVHGNWMEHAEARRRAIHLYRLLVGTVDCKPICFIAFSWPSERQEGFARDVLGKKPRLDADSYYLARAIEMLPLQHSAGFIGYSFGSAVLCGAHHLLNGGGLENLQLNSASHINAASTSKVSHPPPARISLIAPAFDRLSLMPNGRYHRVLLGTEKLVNLYNSADPVLKRFRFFDRETSPAAAGFAGIPEIRVPVKLTSSHMQLDQLQSPLPSDSKIVQFDCRHVGRTHAELDYYTSPAIVRSLENVLGR